MATMSAGENDDFIDYLQGAYWKMWKGRERVYIWNAHFVKIV